jgi:hypothetical protein
VGSFGGLRAASSLASDLFESVVMLVQVVFAEALIAVLSLEVEFLIAY